MFILCCSSGRTLGDGVVGKAPIMTICTWQYSGGVNLVSTSLKCFQPLYTWSIFLLNRLLLVHAECFHITFNILTGMHLFTFILFLCRYIAVYFTLFFLLVWVYAPHIGCCNESTALPSKPHIPLRRLCDKACDFVADTNHESQRHKSCRPTFVICVADFGDLCPRTFRR